MKVVVAIDSLKGCLASAEAGEAAALGVRSRWPDAEVVCLPVSDGGEGWLEAFRHVLGNKAEVVETTVCDPLLRPVRARYLKADDLAVIEVAEACGLHLLKPEERNPLLASSRGVGELLSDAVHRGCRHFIIGLGGSGVSDAGRGMIEGVKSERMKSEKYKLLEPFENKSKDPLLTPPAGGGWNGENNEEVKSEKYKLLEPFEDKSKDPLLTPPAGGGGNEENNERVKSERMKSERMKSERMKSERMKSEKYKLQDPVENISATEGNSYFSLFTPSLFTSSSQAALEGNSYFSLFTPSLFTSSTPSLFTNRKAFEGNSYFSLFTPSLFTSSTPSLFTFIIATDVTNPLYGSEGAAAVFGPQKGATAEMVVELDKRARAFAEENARQMGFDRSQEAGAGAAGGLGYAFMQFFDAERRSGAELLLEMLHFDELIRDADLIITGEGRADRQTLMGKLPAVILCHAQQTGVPCHLLVGEVQDEEALLAAGFASVRSINPPNLSLDEAMRPEVARQNLMQVVKQL